MAVKRIASEDLEIGMYVSRLDRPWRETPFLFQGFYVEDWKELDILRRLCRHVYIVTGEPAPARAQPDPADDGQTKSGSPVAVTTVPEVAFEDELASVKKYHEDMCRVLKDSWHNLRKGRTVPRPALEECADAMVGSLTRNPNAYILLSRLKQYDNYAYAHAANTALWAAMLGSRLMFTDDRLQQLTLGAMLLDVGNLRLPREVLDKRERLTDEEWDLIKTHVVHGVALLRSSGFDNRDLIDTVAGHHERYDGSGYPKGLEGDEIPLTAQIAGIVDAYVSATYPRSIRKAMAPDLAVNVLYKQQNLYFKAELVNEFIGTVGLYPPGTMVELSTGEIALVLSPSPQRRLRPRVMLVHSNNGKTYKSYPILDLVKNEYDSQGRAINIVRAIRDGDHTVDLKKLPF